ncbi:SDR family oxidoreductase [soil metagenome]
MIISIVGGHGQIARRLSRILSADGHTVRALVRNPDHLDDVAEDGAEGVLCDIEADDADVEAAVEGSDGIVFAAGAGPGSGKERKVSVDQQGVERTVAAAEARGVGRYVVISSMGAGDPPTDDEVFSVYLRAKAAADQEALASSLDVTIVRPGALTDDQGTGQVVVGAEVDRGEIPRDDVAAVVDAVLADGSTIGHTFEVVGGPTPIAEAVAEVAAIPEPPA